MPDNPTPATIPWYQSNTLRGVLLSLVSQALMFAKAKGWLTFDLDASVLVDLVLQLGAAGGAIWAFIARSMKPTPPVTLTKSCADAANTPKLHPSTVALALFLVLTALGGCQRLAVQEAVSPEQKAAALLGDFTVYQSASLKIATDETVPAEVRRKVAQTAVDAKPVADQLDLALREYRSIAGQLAAGASTDDKLKIAAANLSRWILELVPLVRSMRSSVEAVAP